MRQLPVTELQLIKDTITSPPAGHESIVSMDNKEISYWYADVSNGFTMMQPLDVEEVGLWATTVASDGSLADYQTTFPSGVLASVRAGCNDTDAGKASICLSVERLLNREGAQFDPAKHLGALGGLLHYGIINQAQYDSFIVLITRPAPYWQVQGISMAPTPSHCAKGRAL